MILKLQGNLIIQRIFDCSETSDFQTEIKNSFIVFQKTGFFAKYSLEIRIFLLPESSAFNLGGASWLLHRY